MQYDCIFVQDQRKTMKNSWLVFTLTIFDYPIKQQQIAPKKIYGIDLGLINAVGFQLAT